MDEDYETQLEQLTFKDGSQMILFQARVMHHINGKIIAGYRYDIDSGETTDRMMIQYGDIKRHRALDWNAAEGQLVENDARMPRSLF